MKISKTEIDDALAVMDLLIEHHLSIWERSLIGLLSNKPLFRSSQHALEALIAARDLLTNYQEKLRRRKASPQQRREKQKLRLAAKDAVERVL